MKKLVDIILAVFICVVLISSYIYALSLYEENKLLKSDIKLKADLIDKYNEELDKCSETKRIAQKLKTIDDLIESLLTRQ